MMFYLLYVPVYTTTYRSYKLYNIKQNQTGDNVNIYLAENIMQCIKETLN